MHEHLYRAQIDWGGNTGQGTRTYAGYDRTFRVTIDGKPELHGSADPRYRGDAHRHNPEDLLLAAVSSCHMLSYLALAARRGVGVLAYSDAAEGRMSDGRFTEVRLCPRVVIEDRTKLGLARVLHDDAHRECFIARSVNFPVHHTCEVEVAP